MLRPLLRGYCGQGPLCTLIKHPLDARLGCLGSLPMLFQLPGSLFLFKELISCSFCSRSRRHCLQQASQILWAGSGTSLWVNTVPMIPPSQH